METTVCTIMFANKVTGPKSGGMEKKLEKKLRSVHLFYYLYIKICNTTCSYLQIQTLLGGVSPSLIVKSGGRAGSHIRGEVMVHIFLGVF